MPKLAKYLGSVAVILAMGGAVQAEEVKADTVVATVNGTQITLGHMASVRESLPPQYQQLPDDVLFEGILEQLIQQTALAEIGQDMMTHRDEILADFVAERRDSALGGSGATSSRIGTSNHGTAKNSSPASSCCRVAETPPNHPDDRNSAPTGSERPLPAWLEIL